MKCAILVLLLLPALCPAQDLMLLNQNTPTVGGTNDITGGELAALWLDGNTADQSGNGNSATAIGSPAYATGQNGVASHSISLNGSSQYLTIGTADSFAAYTNQAFSISFWVYPTSLVTCFPVNVGNGLGADGYCFEINANGQVSFWNSGASTYVATSSGAIGSTNTWYFLTFVYDGANAFIYVNGVSQGSGALANFTAPTTNPFTIGCYYVGSFQYGFTGSIDDFRVYGTNLSTGAITNLYNNGAYGP
jgi:hypothetical protein